MERPIINKNIKGWLLLCVIGVVASGCYYDNEEDLYENYYSNNKCDTTDVSFSDFIMPLVDGNCATTGCHVAGGAGNGILMNYQNVKAKVDNGSFRERVIVQQNMPPNEPLTECQLNKIESWLDAGAPNN